MDNMVLKEIGSAIEKILNDDVIISTKKSYNNITDSDIHDIYSNIQSAVGKDNLILFGGCALLHYIKHKPSDVDVIIRYGGDIKALSQKLSDKFDKLEMVSHPFLNAKVYKTIYTSDSGQKISVDMFTNPPSKRVSIDGVFSRGKRAYTDGMLVNVANQRDLAEFAYASWKNRLFNGRGDKDHEYLVNLDRKFGDSTVPPQYISGTHSNPASRLKSVLGVYIAGAMRDRIRKEARY